MRPQLSIDTAETARYLVRNLASQFARTRQSPGLIAYQRVGPSELGPESKARTLVALGPLVPCSTENSTR